MKKIIFLFLFSFSQTSFCQLAIQCGDSVTVAPSDMSIQLFQEALSIDKNSFIGLGFPNPDYKFLNKVLDFLKLEFDNVSLIFNPIGNSLSIPPFNYLELLEQSWQILHDDNERIMEKLGL
jgi:hypothetical protein